MTYKPSRKFVTEDAIAIDYELRKIAQKMPTGGSGTITGVTAGDAISGGGTTGTVTVNFAPSELSSVTVASDDKVIIADTSDSDNPKTVTASSIAALAPQGDITEVVAGTALSGGGSSGSVTLNVADVAVAQLADAAVQTSSESFADNDTSLMTSAAIQDKILSYGYITGVTNISGNAGTATALQTARTIGGVSFDGTANIDLAGVNTAGNQNTSGNAATATLAATTTALATARAINGVDFDGTAPITVTAAAGTLTGTELKSTVVTSSLTSVGTLGSLTVSGAFTPATVTASTVTVAADDLVLITDTSDSANVKKVTAQSIADLGGGGGGSPAGSDHQVQWNDSGSFGADANLTYDGSTLTVNANLGIGTSSPVGQLSVDSQNRQISIIDSGTTNFAEIRAHATDNATSYANVNYNAYSHNFVIEGSRKLYIDNNGDILPDTDSTIDLGSSSRYFAKSYVDIMYVSNEIIAGNGSSGDPSYCFASDNSAGMYLVSSGTLGWSIASGEMRLNSTSLHPNSNEGLSLGKAGSVWNHFYLGQAYTFSSGGYYTLRSRDSDRQVMELVSSERFKADIVDMPLNEAYQVLDARPILYRGVDDDSSVPLEAGLSAESLHNAGYEYAVRYDEGHWGETPRSIYYEYLTAPIIRILQDMQERITYLEENKCQCQMNTNSQ